MKGLKLTLTAWTCVFLSGLAAAAQDAKPAIAATTNAVLVAGVASTAAAGSAPSLAVSNLPISPGKSSAPSSSVSASNGVPTGVVVSQTAPSSPDRSIRFQFDGIPYTDAVERFAQMVNKPLVTGTNIQGTLTYNDPQPYSYAEALDTLNLMLSMKGVTLLEDGHYLRLVPFRELPQLPIRILRGLDNTGDVRPGEIVTVVLEVKNLDTKEVGEAVVSMLSNAGSIAPLSRGRGLIVTDRLANIQRIRSLLSALDTESVAERQMKAYTLLHASGAVVADLINRTFGSATAPKRTQYNPQSKQMDTLPADPNEYVTAVYDNASRTLVLFGPRDRLALAEALVSKFEDKEGAGGEVRIYYPESMRASELATMIRQAVSGVASPDENATTAATKARLVVDNAQNRLIVAAPVAGQLEQIELLINKVDRPIHGTAKSSDAVRSQTVQVTKVFRPRAIEAANVAKILTDAFTRRLPNGDRIPTASVTVEPNSQSVVVTGPPGEAQTAEEIVAQLESSSSLATPQQTRFIEVGNVGEAKRLLPLVEQIFRSQVTDGPGGPASRAKLMADPESGRLIVTASAEHLERIEAIVKQLRAEQAKPQPRRLQIIPLKHLRVDAALSSINNLVNERLSDRRFEGLVKPLLLPDGVNNRLLVTATDDQTKEIQDVVSTLDVAPDATRREMVVIPLQSKSASELISLTTQLMTQLTEPQANPQLAPKLIPDSTGKGLIVVALPQDLARITNLVQQLDSASATATTRQSKAVELFNRTPAEMTSLAQQLYLEQIKGQAEPAGGPATIVSDAKNNRLIVSGSEKEIARVETIVRQLDPEGKIGAKEETRVIRLKAALAGELASLVEKSLTAQSHRVKVLVDARSNSLVVTGESDSVRAAAQVIEQLDTRSDVQPRELRLIELKQGDANTIAPMVTSLSTEMLKDQRGADYAPQTKIVPDPVGNRLILTGPKEELVTVSAVVEQLNQTPEAAGGARVFKLNLADAMTVLPVVSNAMLRFDVRNQPIRRVSVSADRESNSIIVSGSRTDLTDAQTIIERLDNEGVEKLRSLKVIDVRTDDPDGLAALALKVFVAQTAGRSATNVVSITPEPSGKRLIVLAPPTLLPQVETVIASLDDKPDQGMRELQTVEVRKWNANEILPIVNRIYTEQTKGRSGKPAAIYADTSGTRFLVYGTRDQAATIRQIVETAESQPPAPRETKAFDLGKLAEAQRVLPLLQQLYRDQINSNPIAGLADAQFVSDGRTGRLIVSARTNQMPLIADIVTRLQVNPVVEPVARETRTFDVGNASDVQRLMPLVQQLYKDQWKDKIETDPADAQITGDPKTGRLIVTGKPEHLKQIEAILNQLSSGRPRADARDCRIYDLTTANAMELATTVRTLYQDQAKARLGTTPPDTLILPDGSSNRLIVSGETAELDFIDEIVKKLDKTSAQSASVRVFKLKFADPSKVSEILSSALIRYDTYGRQQRRVSVVVDTKSRTLICAGDPRELQGASVIIEQLDSIGEQPERKMKVFRLKSGEAYDVSSKLRQLYQDRVKNQPELGISDALMLEDSTSNQIIVAGSEQQVKVIEEIITQLQEHAVARGPRETKSFEIGRAEDVTRLQTMVQRLYQDRWRAKDASEPADAQIYGDTLNGRLLVTGKPEHIKEIEDILKSVWSPASSAEARDTQVYDLNTTSAPELAVTVRSLYQEQLKTRPVAPMNQAIILPDAAANRLVVSGNTNELAILDDIVRKLDRVDAQSGRTRVFKLKTAEAEQVATMLSTALSRFTPSGRLVPRVSVGTDKENNLLIVSGEPKDLQAAAVVVEQMDAILAKEPRQMRVIPLKSGVASQVAARVTSLYQDQMKGQPNSGVANALILGDDPGNRLIVTATEAHLKMIEEIIKPLQEAPDTSARQLRVVLLQRNSAASLATMISQLFGRQISSQDPGEHLVVTPAFDDRTLVLEAGAPTLEKVSQLVRSLDGEDAPGKVEVRTYQIPEGSAADLAPTLGRLFAERTGRSGTTIGPRFEADADASLLMVAATKDQFVQIEKLIEEIKKTVQVANEIRTFKLQNGDPASIADVLHSMLTDDGSSPFGPPFGQQQGQQPGQARPRRLQWRPGVGLQPMADTKGVRVAPAPAMNAVVVQGPPEKLVLAEKLIQTLDSDEGGGQTVLQTIRLKKARAENLAEAVTRVISTRSGTQTQGRLQRVSVTPVYGPNSLLLNGPASAVKDVLKIVQELDQESEDDEVKVHIYRLENGNAREVSSVVQQLLQNLTREQFRSRSSGSPPPRTVQPTVAVEQRSNSLVVSGTAAHFKMVEQLLQTLDKAPERAERDVQFVWLRNAKALDVVLKVEAVFAGRSEADRPVVESDTFNNSITIIGKRADIAQAQELISRLDESSKDTSLQVRLRPIDRVPVEQMAQMLQNLYPQLSPGQIRMVERIPAQGRLDKQSPVITVPRTNQPPVPVPAPAPPGEKAASKPTEEAPAAEVVIALDKAANALVLSGPTHELDQIDRIITELTFSYVSSDAEFRVFPLKEADPLIVAKTLNDLFRPEPVPGQPPQQQQQQQQQNQQGRVVVATPKVTVVAEPRTRSVIVRAKPTDFILMEALIKQIDVFGVSSQLEYRLVPLTNAPPEKLVPLVQQMVTQMNLVRPGEPLTVTADARTRGLLLVGRDSALKQIEPMIRGLDTPSPFVEAEVLVISLKRASAAQLFTILNGMMRPAVAGAVGPEVRELQEQVRRLRVKNDAGKEVLLDLSKPIKILSEPGGPGSGNRLVFYSTPDNLKAIAAVVEMMDTPAIMDGLFVKLVHLDFADASTVAQTLNTIFQQGQRLTQGPTGRAEPESTQGKALAHPLNVVADDRSNGLILSGQKESVELAQKIISDLDRKLERFVTEVKIYRLKYASATRLQPLLQSVFTEGPAVPGTEGLATQVTRLRALVPEEQSKMAEQPKARAALIVRADDTTNMLIVSARSDNLPLIEAVINQLDIPAASGMDGIRIYPLEHADVTTVESIIQDMYRGPRSALLRLDDRPNITIDPRTQSLVVCGNEKAFAFIDSLLLQLDKKLPLELRDVRIIPLENADAIEAAATLQRLLDARVTQKAALSKQQADALKVLIIGEPRSNSLLLTGSKDSFELVETLVKELDRVPTALSGRIRLIPLVHADARYVSTALANLFSQRYQAVRSAEVQRARPVIIPDLRSNSLMVAAGVDDNQVIDDLLQRLDRKVEDPNMVLTVLPLKHNDAGRVTTTLESIFAARSRSRSGQGQGGSPQDQVQIEPDSLNNALVISSSKENLEIIKGLLEKIDIEPTAVGGLVQVFTFEFADAQRVASILRALVQQGLYRPGMSTVGGPGGGGAGGGGFGRSRRDAMAITVDSRSNSLIVSASPENLLIIKEVIKQVDKKDFDQASNIRVYSLKHARASTLATVLDQFFRARRTGGGGGFGDFGAVAAAERMVPVTIVPDDRVNALLITGGKESFDVIERLIQQLDIEDAQARMNFRVFPLKQSTASKMQSTLQRLFANRPSRTRGEPAEPITLVADSWANALIVGASVDDMSMVASLIERLDSEQGQSGMTVQVLPLAKADARRVAQTVQGLFREGAVGAGMSVVVTADERMNALVVSAGEADMKRIAELVKKLDTDQVSRVSEIRVFPLRYARADSLSSILNSALNTQPASLTGQSPNSASLLQFITRGEDGKALVASALKEGVLITPDTRMNSLIVSAQVDCMGLLEQIITRLDSTTPQHAKIKVFTLTNSHARQMSDLLRTLFRLTATGGISAANQRAVQYTLVKRIPDPDGPSDDPNGGEETEVASATLGTDEQSALTVTIDARTNSLIIGGTEEYVELVSQIITTLDNSEAQERKSEVFRLKNAQAAELQTTVRSFLDQERTRVTQVLGQEAVATAQLMMEREVSIVAEPTSNALLISATPSYFGQVRQLIEQLDQPQPQVLIQVLLAEVTLDSTRDLGIEWNVTKAVENAKVATGTSLGVLNELQSFGGFSTAVTGSDFGFLIRALENSGRLEVLSRPQILTSDNKPANINVGQRVPLITDSRVTQFGDSINTFAYQNVGVNLQVTPRIGSGGNVKMEISTTNSALSSSSVEVGSSSKSVVKMPIINERRATTSVSVQSGQSIIIGGLISTSEDDRVKKVPYLGDIPYLGALFRSKTRISDRKELLILLTPQVLVNVGETAKVGDPKTFTDDQLNRSSLKDQIKRDKYRDQLLEPFYPERSTPTPNGKQTPSSSSSAAPKQEGAPSNATVPINNLKIE